MTQDRGTGLNTGSSLDTFGHAGGMSDALSIDNDVMRLASGTVQNDLLDQLLLIKIIIFRKQNIISAIGDTTPQRNISGMTSHNLNDGAALMRSRSISDLIDGFHGCIDSSIKTDGIICTGNIQVNGSGNTDSIDALIGQLLGTGKGTVTTDNYQAIDTILLAGLYCGSQTFRSTHLGTSCCIQDRTAALNDIGNITAGHVYHLIIDQAIIALQDPLYRNVLSQGSSYDRTDRRIHARCITTAGQDTDCLNFFLCHNKLLLHMK